MASNLQFVSWSRRGVAVGKDVGAPRPDDGRLHVTRRLTVWSTVKDELPISQEVETATLTVFGPGDVTGIDPSQIVRRAPRPDDQNLEPNYLACIEFAHPDLPWMFSPEPQLSEEKAHPWLMLVVVPFVDDKQVIAGPVGKPCPVLYLPAADVTPDPGDAWAFAHVQARTTGSPVDLIRAANADLVRSRLICPTHLRPDTHYLAAVVPTYEIGRLAGLGMEIPDGTGLARWVPAAQLQLPVYDSWRFRTGPSGDFETLAKKLHRVGPEGGDLGIRKVAIEARAALMQPHDEEPDEFAAVCDVPTAITKIAGARQQRDVRGVFAPDISAPDVPDPNARALLTHLKKLVDLVAGAEAEDPMVGPPLYGQWAAEVSSLDGAPDVTDLAPVPADSRRTWIEQLNADPYLRAAAGVATLVVQHDQEQLMADAWRQLEDVQAANHRGRMAALYAFTAVKLHDRVASLAPHAALRLLAPALGRLRVEADATFRARLEDSTVPREALGPALIRTARFAVRAAVRESDPAVPATELLTTSATVAHTVESLRSSADVALPARYTTARAINPSILDELSVDAEFGQRLHERLGEDPAIYLGRLRDVPGTIETLAGRFATVPAAALAQPGDGQPSLRLKHDAVQRVTDISQRAVQMQDHGEVELSPQLDAEIHAMQQHGFDRPMSLDRVRAINDVVAQISAVQAAQQVPQDQRVQALNLANDAEGLQVEQVAGDALSPVLKASGISGRKADIVTVMTALSSATLTGLGLQTVSLTETFGHVNAADESVLKDAVQDLVSRHVPANAKVATPNLTPLDLDLAGQLVAKMEPVRAYETMLSYAHQFVGETVKRRATSPFHPAMASPLFPKPAVDRLKSLDQEWVLGGVGKLKPNSVCLLGVNWRFVEAFMAGANHEMARELLWRGFPTDLRGTCFRRFWNGPAEDIAAMDSWSGPLGAQAPARKELTILLIKGDLLRRYPNTIISAELGTPEKVGEEVVFTADDVAGAHRPELFRGFLGQDVSYVAIDVDPAELAFTDDANLRHCWYISLLEPHDEPRFGLDDPAGGAPEGSNLAKHPHDSGEWSWPGLDHPSAKHLNAALLAAADNSAQVASNLFQQPFRMLLRAREYV